MPYCPKCKLEYKAGISNCPDCGRRLVNALENHSRRGLDDDVDSVLLLKTMDYVKAHLLAASLEEAGIRYWAKRLGLGARLGSSGTASIDHVVYDGPKPAEIYVLPGDLERAQDILAVLAGNSADDEQ